MVEVSALRQVRQRRIRLDAASHRGQGEIATALPVQRLRHGGLRSSAHHPGHDGEGAGSAGQQHKAELMKAGTILIVLSLLTLNGLGQAAMLADTITYSAMFTYGVCLVLRDWLRTARWK